MDPTELADILATMPDPDALELGDIGLDSLDMDLTAFLLESQEGTVLTRYVKPPLYVGTRRTPVMYEHAAELVREASPAIAAGERVSAILSGNFIFGDFIEALAVENNLEIDDLTLSTLSLNQNSVDSLRNLMVGGYLNTLNLVVSDYFYSNYRHAIPYVYEQLDMEDRFQFAVAGTHTKVALLRVQGQKGPRKYVMHGSANLRSSRSVESLEIEENAVLYDFHMEWHTKILEYYGTIKKSIRAGKLFTLIQEQAA